MTRTGVRATLPQLTRLQEVIKRRQIMLIQVVKEEARKLRARR